MVVCDVAMVLAIMPVLMAMMMVVVGDDDGACDVKHVGRDGVGDDADDDAMLIMVAATMMRRGGGDTCVATFREHPPCIVDLLYTLRFGAGALVGPSVLHGRGPPPGPRLGGPSVAPGPRGPGAQEPRAQGPKGPGAQGPKGPRAQGPKGPGAQGKLSVCDARAYF